MASEFGKQVRKLRIDNNETMRDMCEAIGASETYISGVELGRLTVTNKLIEKIAGYYNLSGPKKSQLRLMADISNGEIRIDISHLSIDDRYRVATKARSFLLVIEKPSPDMEV